MKKNNLFIGLLMAGTSLSFGQITTLSVSVKAALDDHEERISGSVPQTQTMGSMDAGSSDLELGNEKPTADPQLVGVRFTSLTIPANAVIVNAYIQFKVDDIAKNTDPCELNVQVEDNANASTFSDNAFTLSSRTLLSTMVGWTVTGTSWGTIGSMGPDQRTPDLKSLVQAIVNKSGWAPGNAIAFYIKGKGTREVESFDGGDPNPPMLVVQYSTTATGVQELSDRSSVSVYPNPFNQSFTIHVDGANGAHVTVSIYDVTGNLVEASGVEKLNGSSFQYTCAPPLSRGLYFAKVSVNNKQHFVKLISE